MISGAGALIAEASRAGLRLHVAAGALLYETASESVDPSLLERLRADRDAVRGLLERQSRERDSIPWPGKSAGPWSLNVRPSPPIDAGPDLDVAASIVDRLNARFLAGEHDLADGAARVLEAALAELARAGIEAWLGAEQLGDGGLR